MNKHELDRRLTGLIQRTKNRRVTSADIKEAELFFAVLTHYRSVKNMKTHFKIDDTRRRRINAKKQVDQLRAFFGKNGRFPRASENQYLFHLGRERLDLKDEMMQELETTLQTAEETGFQFLHYTVFKKLKHRRNTQPRRSTAVKIAKNLLAFYRIHRRFPGKVAEMQHLYKIMKSSNRDIVCTWLNAEMKRTATNKEYEEWQCWFNSIQKKYNLPIRFLPAPLFS